MTRKIKYLKPEDVIDFNKEILKDIKAKKADRHELLSYTKLKSSINRSKRKPGDIHDKAACLIKGIVQEHPFSSANRRTAFGVTEQFLEKNKKKFNVDNGKKHARVLQGIREGYYKDDEIKKWIKGRRIRKFRR